MGYRRLLQSNRLGELGDAGWPLTEPTQDQQAAGGSERTQGVGYGFGGRCIEFGLGSSSLNAMAHELTIAGPKCDMFA
jgi:hypothetical protein